jgi:hypothetical protein
MAPARLSDTLATPGRRGARAAGRLLALLALAPTGAAQDLILSEYVEGSGSNWAVEVFNLGPTAVDIGEYELIVFRDGHAFAAFPPIALPHRVLHSPDVHVVAHPAAVLPIVPDQTSNLLWFDGDDVIALKGPAGVVDAIGEIGFDPGSAWTGGGISTKNQTLRRVEVNCASPAVGMGRFDPSLQWAGFPVDDFSGLGLPPAGLVPTSCGTGSASYCTAGTSASWCQAQLSAVGVPSATSPSGFVLTAANVEGAKEGLFFFGTGGRQAVPWGNGGSFQCVVPPVKRTGLQDGTGTSGLCDGTFSLDFNAYLTANPQKNPGAGFTVQAQAWFRDPQNTSNQTTSLSNALEFVLCD